MTFKINKTREVAVSLEVHWKPVDVDTPNGVKMLVINRHLGVAQISIFRREDGWTHWHPLPRFKDPL